MFGRVLLSKTFDDIPFSISMLPQNIEIIDTEIVKDERLTSRVKNFVAEGVARIIHRPNENGATIAEIIILSSHQIDCLSNTDPLSPINITNFQGDLPDVLKQIIEMFETNLDNEQYENGSGI